MSKPSWKEAEDEFISFFPYKYQYVFQFHDTRAAMGVSGTRNVVTTEHPADFCVTDNGEKYYAEVKKCEHATSFGFKNIRPGQWAASIREIAAGGQYFFFIRHDPKGEWYKVPAALFHYIREDGSRSIKWIDLFAFRWQI